MRTVRWVAVLALGLPACSGVGQARGLEDDTPVGIDGGEVVVVETAEAIEGIDAASGRQTFRLEGAVFSPDEETLYAVQDGELVVADAQSGEETSATPVSDGLVTSASRNGLVALVTEGSPSFPDVPSGRTSTPIEIVDTQARAGDEASRQSWTLEGNYEPEAFSLDGDKLFLIEYLPAEAPDRYRVRMLDTESGDVLGLPSQHKVPQASMRGERVQQVLSPDGKVLYTLYESYDPANEGIAFIHVLNLEEKWAHCVDLPLVMAPSWARHKALAMSPDGSELFVTDSGSGTLAMLRTRDLYRTIEPLVVMLPKPARNSSARAQLSEDGMLWVAAGSVVARYRTDALGDVRREAPERWTFDGVIRDLFVPDDGSVALVLVGSQIVAQLPGSGEGFSGGSSGSAGWIPAHGAEQIVSFEPSQ